MPPLLICQSAPKRTPRCHSAAKRRNLLLVLALVVAANTIVAQSPLPIAPTRHSPDDLELTGLIATPGFISYATLSTLPQITTPVRNDSNFAGQSIRVTGIPLEALAKALGAAPNSDLIDALCTDRYRAHYPAAYIARHHPILALKIDGERIEAWAARTHSYDPGPYFITHAHFVPGPKILAHDEEPQIPDNITRLNFTTAAATFGPLTPHGGSYAPDSPELQGFAIAKQNCLRCHSLGPVGGTKSGRDWLSLSTWAREQPAYFARYVHDPTAVETHAHMPPNPTYDAATLAALTAYFRTFTEETKPK
jgi:mono/diheme cytochrome c family protein